MSPTGPNFGTASGTSSVQRSQNAEPIQLADGFAMNVFWRQTGDSRAESQEILTAFGIEASATNPIGAVLESVTESVSEDVLPHFCWTGVSADTSLQAKPLLHCDAIVVIRTEHRYSIRGYMDAALTVDFKTKLGKEVAATPIDVKPAIGGVDEKITIPATALVVAFQEEKQNSNWSSFSAELVSYTANTGNIDAHTELGALLLAAIKNTAIFPVTDISALGQNENKFRCSMTKSYAAGTWATTNWSVEVFTNYDE